MGLERLGLPARAIEGDDQELVDALAQRMLSRQVPEVGQQVLVAPASELGLEPALRGKQSQLLQPRRNRLHRRLVGQVGERRARPQVQRSGERGRRFVEVLALEREAALLRETLESGQVERVGPHPDRVARPAGDDRVPADQLAQVGDGPLDDVRGAGGRIVVPQLVDQPLCRDDRVRLGEQQNQRRAVPGRPEVDRPAVDERLERTQQAIFDPHGFDTRGWEAQLPAVRPITWGA